jgi:hypothetical protein
VDVEEFAPHMRPAAGLDNPSAGEQLVKPGIPSLIAPTMSRGCRLGGGFHAWIFPIHRFLRDVGLRIVGFRHISL